MSDKVFFIKDETPLSQKMQMYLDINNIEHEVVDYSTLDDTILNQLVDKPPVITKGHRTLYGFDANELNRLLK